MQVENYPFLMKDYLDGDELLPIHPPAHLTISDLQRKCEDIDSEIKEIVMIEKFGKKFSKRFAKQRKNKGGNCPCCEQPLNTPERVAIYERNLLELISMKASTSGPSVRNIFTMNVEINFVFKLFLLSCSLN